MTATPVPSSPLRPFAARVLVVLAIGALALLAWQLSELLLIMFGAVVVAVLLHGLTLLVRRWIRVPDWAALGLVVTVLVVVLAGIFTLFGTEVAGQIDTFRETLPAAWNKFHAWLQASPLGPQLERLPEQLRQGASTLAAHAGAFVMSAGRGVTDAVLMVVGGLYLAAQPDLYRRGVLRLLPLDQRPVADEALSSSGKALRAWLGGQLLAMAVIGTLTGLGLWALGVPVALGIGLLTALLDFIPIVGRGAGGDPGHPARLHRLAGGGAGHAGAVRGAAAARRPCAAATDPGARGGPAAGAAAVLAVRHRCPVRADGRGPGRADDGGAVRAGQAALCAPRAGRYRSRASGLNRPCARRACSPAAQRKTNPRPRAMAVESGAPCNGAFRTDGRQGAAL
ncbi:hypothetical protein QE438_003101 [Pseudoxanthomonas sp. SORGH_AS 997]|nr:hypothetical protein [Pseudoxanthomonas sp. SORGH_AS_0997]